MGDVRICERCRVLMTPDNASPKARLCRPCVTAQGREWRERHPEAAKAKAEKWNALRRERRVPKRKLIENPSVRYGYALAYKARNPEKYRARKKTSRAIQEGRLIKQPCVRCGSTDVHAHHEDYSKPLDVVWLCPSHHRERHAELNAARK